MIISHKYKFIFIKTHKTAGSSMEMALGPLCGPEDVVTPMESNWETDIPRNYYEKSGLGKLYARNRTLRKLIDRHSPLIGKWYYEHIPAMRVRQLVGEDTWNSYYKFCYERNPWEKVVSYYNWKKHGQGKKVPSFRDYVLKKSHRLPMDAKLYTEKSAIIVNDVLDFKDFKTSFQNVCVKLGVPFDGNMPREKTNMTEKPVSYRDYYDDETRQKVAECFALEIELFGYEF